MDNKSARLVARNIFAKHSGCTRREAERQLLDASDESCQVLAGMDIKDAARTVSEFVLESARKIVSASAKEPSTEAEAGLSGAADVQVDVQENEQEVTHGESESGLDPD